MSPFTRNEGRAKLLAKNRQTFILQTTKLTRVARRVCEDILQPRRAARRPYASINANAVKAECTCMLAAVSEQLRGHACEPVGHGVLFVSSGMIRLPKATKTPLKSKLVPRQSLATIVKDLGKSTSCDQCGAAPCSVQTCFLWVTQYPPVTPTNRAAAWL